MSSKNDDSQNHFDSRTNFKIRGEAKSSPDGQDKVDQEPTIAYYLPASTNGRETHPRAPNKANARKKQQGTGVPKMRALLDTRDVPAARHLDDELITSTTTASLVCSKIRKTDLEVIMAFVVSNSILLWAPSLNE
ncbi:hypothetical protein Adt_11568 [Abeliophyllum distichum]|uniref:Uncharacterized protein n=1 Tax=Abeliophyllum distichum TaxID=126358 RepID=A0ABD1UN81_9LAMI